MPISLAMILLWVSCSLDLFSQEGCAPREPLRFVSTRQEEQAIVVDRGGQVFQMVWEKGTFQCGQSLGHEVRPPASLQPLQSIAKDEVLVSAQKYPCSDCAEPLWFIVTAALAEGQLTQATGTFDVFNFVYVFRKRSGVELLLKKKFSDVVDLTVRDLDGDGRKDLAVQYVDEGASPWTWLQVWRIKADGELESLALDVIVDDLGQAGQVELGVSGSHLYSEQTEIMKDGILVVRKTYGWDPKTKGFHLIRTTKKQTAH